jgi:hypothetical protein
VDEDESGHSKRRNIEFAAVTAVVATLLCLFLGQAAQQFAAITTTPETPIAQTPPRFNAIDYARTASVKGATVVIGPCDNRTR